MRNERFVQSKVTIEHCSMRCARSFDEVHRAMIAAIPSVKPELADMLVRADQNRIAEARRDWAKLWMFLMRDHGALTAADGRRGKAMQYEIGNPLTAERMTRHLLAAGLYAPLRVILYEDENGQTVFEYDLPSSLFGQFGDDRVTSVGLELDFELRSALAEAGGLAESGGLKRSP